MITKSLESFIDILQHYAEVRPTQQAYQFLRNGEEDGGSITFAELDMAVRQLAAHLQEQNLTGERALLLYHSGLEYVVSLLACFYAGTIAVPAYPPRNSRNLPRLQTIVEDAGAKAILTTTTIADKVKEFSTETGALGDISWILSDADIDTEAENWRHPGVGRDAIAYLQYTSGSTGAPKGVMVSHGNLIHNSESIHQLFAHDEHSKMVSWLPIFHDLGLIFGLLQSLYGGFPCIFMSPAAFLQRPFRWLKAMSDYRATTTGAPNFAFDLCLRKISEEQKCLLDLSHWQAALNGAEPVRPHTLEKFHAYFSSCGLGDAVLSPCYGLAEATLVVSGTPVAHTPRILQAVVEAMEHDKVVIPWQTDAGKCQTLVTSGIPFADQDVLIVEPQTGEPLAENLIGEIWVSGPSVAKGYWQRERETTETFKARIKGDGRRHYLRTGDLGFLTEGELCVTGRLKDVVIIRGRNLYPQDIELVSERSHPALRPTGAAAFSVEMGGEERLVIVQELEFKQKPDYEAVIDAIRQEIAEHFEIQPYAVLLIKPGTIQKTSSGKIQRKLTREQFLENKLELIAEWREEIPSVAGTDAVVENLSRQQLLSADSTWQPRLVESFLRANLARVLKLEESKIDTRQPLVVMGLDSLGAATLVDAIDTSLDVNLPIGQLFENASVVKLTDNILTQLQAG